jgi:hypothetical protein
MEREKEPNDPAKTKTEGNLADTAEKGIPAAGKKAAHGVGEERKPADNDKSREEGQGGIREDQPGRDRRGDRNSI